MKFTRIEVPAVIVCLVMIISLMIGLRDATIGTDTNNYIKAYDLLREQIGSGRFEYVFGVLQNLFSFFALPVCIFLSFISLISFLALIIITSELNNLFKKTQGNYRLYLLLTSILFFSPFFFASQVNVIRHGVSIFFLIAVYLLILNRSHWIGVGILSVLAIGFHKTAIIYLCFVPLLFLSYQAVTNFTLFMGLLYCLKWSEKLVFNLSPGIYKAVTDYGSLEHYQSGRRIDFTLFTIFIGFLFYLLSLYFIKKEEQISFNSLIKIYWILSLPFFFFGFGAYSDRYLLPAWVYIAIPATLFLNMQFLKFNISIYWYYLLFIISASYFILKAQGVIG